LNPRRRLLPRLALLSLAGSGFLLQACRPAEETRFLNFDPESSAGALPAGWSGFEKTGDADTFVWAQARTATVAVSSRAKGDQLVRFRCWPFRFPGAPPQTVTVFVNGSRVESIPMADGPRVYALATPEALWKSGRNDVRFEFAYAEAPKDRVPGASDERTLSVAFDWLEVLPATRPDRKS
jgi:hypothetical protein